MAQEYSANKLSGRVALLLTLDKPDSQEAEPTQLGKAEGRGLWLDYSQLSKGTLLFCGHILTLSGTLLCFLSAPYTSSIKAVSVSPPLGAQLWPSPCTALQPKKKLLRDPKPFKHAAPCLLVQGKAHSGGPGDSSGYKFQEHKMALNPMVRGGAFQRERRYQVNAFLKALCSSSQKYPTRPNMETLPLEVEDTLSLEESKQKLDNQLYQRPHGRSPYNGREATKNSCCSPIVSQESLLIKQAIPRPLAELQQKSSPPAEYFPQATSVSIIPSTWDATEVVDSQCKSVGHDKGDKQKDSK
ncbi:hypothetical protein H920_00635 [Fukomys damarensis]|uniref:Uncharacterized protein n=1 Tax=Fukomys damarensis TaxID=885580 RepID=A0A091E5Z7_FUKDA|nr:hypothetical protein H920_00635 [Fukomys damarensis]